MERLTRRQEKAKTELVLAIKEAVLAGLDVDNFFIDHEGKLKTLDTQLSCLRLAVFFAFFDPIALYGIKLYCAINRIPLELPEAVILWVATLTMISIVGFGFKLVRLPKWLGGGVEREELSVSVSSIPVDSDTLTRLRALNPGSPRRGAEEIGLETTENFYIPSNEVDRPGIAFEGWDGSIETRSFDSTGPTEG